MTRKIVPAAAAALAFALLADANLSAGGRPEQGAVPAEGSMMMSSQAAEKASPRLAPSTGKKVIFTSLPDAQALAEKGPAVLFFAADWCPTCIAALRDINANGAKLGNIAVIVVDYDAAADLKARYGVTSQHTFVQIDPRGAQVSAWNGGGVDAILKNTRRG